MANLVQSLGPLSQHTTLDYEITVRTSYGLQIQRAPDGSIRMSTFEPEDNTDVSKDETDPFYVDPDHPAHAYDEDTPDTSAGYRYSISPETGLTHVCYEAGWPGNPDIDTFDVLWVDIKARYSRPWVRAYFMWSCRYDKAFSSTVMIDHTRDIWENQEQEHAWNLEGMLLAAWLALQERVESVQFDAWQGHSYRFAKAERESFGEVLTSFLKDIDKSRENIATDADGVEAVRPESS